MNEHGRVGWRSDAWRDEATRWLDARLAEAGIARIGAVEQPRVRPWGTVLRAPTTAGPVWLKACGALRMTPPSRSTSRLS